MSTLRLLLLRVAGVGVELEPEPVPLAVIPGSTLTHTTQLLPPRTTRKSPCFRTPSPPLLPRTMSAKSLTGGGALVAVAATAPLLRAHHHHHPHTTTSLHTPSLYPPPAYGGTSTAAAVPSPRRSRPRSRKQPCPARLLRRRRRGIRLPGLVVSRGYRKPSRIPTFRRLVHWLRAWGRSQMTMIMWTRVGMMADCSLTIKPLSRSLIFIPRW